MAQLNQFNGGLNTRVAPHLINVNEGQKYTNVDNTSITLKPVKEDSDENTSVGDYIVNFKDTWFSSSTYKDYVEFQERLYYTDCIGRPQKSDDGINWYNLGIDKPEVQCTIEPFKDGGLTGTYQYCYTYYNSSDGSESAPSKYSTELTVDNKVITVNYTASGDPQVDTIRLYRLGGNLTTMTLVTEVANETSSYDDSLNDLDVNGHLLDSFNNQPPPEGLCYLTEHNAMFFGVKDDKLYYSAIAYVNNWSTFNFIDFNDKLTGLGVVANGLLVFTKFRTYIVTGTSPLTLSNYMISASQGCLYHKSISFAKNTLLWASTDGICASAGGIISVVSRPNMGKLQLKDIRDAVVYDDVYYISYGDKLMAYDTRFGNILRYINQETTSMFIYDDRLYYSLNNKLFSLCTADNYRELEYKSPRLSDGQVSNLKNYKVVYVKCFGNLTIKIYIDGILVATRDIDSQTSEILVPQQNRKGYYIEFEVLGTGELLEFQYAVEGRQNGR